MKTVLLLFSFFSLPVFADEMCLAVIEKHEYVNEQDSLECLWNETRTAFSFCVQAPEVGCFIVDSRHITDVTQVQKSNLGKLGLVNENQYRQISTRPKEWLSSKGGTYLVTFETQAWKNDQRYTISGPAAVVNGKYYEQ